MDTVNLVVLLDESGRSRIDGVTRSAQEQGLHVEQTFPMMGTIVGSADRSAIERLSRIDGVQMVREEQMFHVPPLDEKVPQ